MSGGEANLGGETASGGNPESTGGSAVDQGLSETSKSGTRLTRRFFESPGGGRLFIDFWDEELGTGCDFREAADGSQRCLVHSRFTGEIYYFSDTCGDPVVTSESTCGPEWGEESASKAVYRKTDQSESVPSDNIGYYRDSANCSSFYATSDAEYFKAELVPSDSFVRGRYQTVERTDGFQVRLIEGEDGSRVYVDVARTEEGYTCAFDDQGYCFPASGYEPSAHQYEDAECASPIYGFNHSDVHLIGVMPRHDRCGNTKYYEPISVEAPTTAYYRNLDGDCVSTTSTSYYYFSEGAQVQKREIPRAEVELLGDGPLRARRFVDSSGEPLTEVVDFWDTTTDQACTPFEKTEGGYVCVPKLHAQVESNNHLDAECNDSDQRALAVCPQGKPEVAIRQGAPFISCDVPNVYTVAAAYEVGESVGPDYYFENDSVDCEMRSSVDWYSTYQTGANAMETLTELALTTAD